MLVKLLGLLDFIAAIFLLLLAISLTITPVLLVLISALLLIKAIVFFSWVGLMDIGAAIVLFLSIFFAMPTFVLIIFLILIFQKAICSMF